MSVGFLADVTDPSGLVQPSLIVSALHVTKSELARAAGLSTESVSKRTRLTARATQTRLREMVEIINRVLPWAGSVPMAFAWYRSQPLPSFGDLTAEDLVKTGRAEAVRGYLSRIAEGGFA